MLFQQKVCCTLSTSQQAVDPREGCEPRFNASALPEGRPGACLFSSAPGGTKPTNYSLPTDELWFGYKTQRRGAEEGTPNKSTSPKGRRIETAIWDPQFSLNKDGQWGGRRTHWYELCRKEVYTISRFCLWCTAQSFREPCSRWVFKFPSAYAVEQ